MHFFTLFSSDIVVKTGLSSQVTLQCTSSENFQEISTVIENVKELSIVSILKFFYTNTDLIKKFIPMK